MAELDISTKNCIVEQEGNVLIVTLNRPEAKNAFSPEMLLGMYKAWRLLDEDDSLRCAILTANGDTFCAGMDLKAFARGEDIGPLTTFIKAGSQKPLIAAIEGCALAGGCEIALTRDLLVASKGSKIGIREVKVGLFAAAGGVFRLPARVGYTKAMEMAITGEPITAEQALEVGMLSELTEAGGALDAAVAWAEKIAENAPLAVAASKTLVRAAAQGIDEESLWKMQEPLSAKVFTSNDAKEGPVAFAEKRAPNWTGT